MHACAGTQAAAARLAALSGGGGHGAGAQLAHVSGMVMRMRSSDVCAGQMDVVAVIDRQLSQLMRRLASTLGAGVA
eukprot:364436-Chlamydomonas_euryale.AAC.2